MNFKLPQHWRSYLTLQNGAVALGLLIALSWSWGTVSTLQKNFQLQQQVDALDQEVELANLENQNLKFQQNYLRSSEFLEINAREKLGKVVPGEKVIILPDSSGIIDKVTEAKVAKTATVKPSNFSQWMQFFFGNKRK
jgi:cell division protein FtsB